MEKILRFFEKYVIPTPLYRIGQPAYHYSLAFLGNVLYRSPSKKIFVVGVTGTKGKSTVIELINAILENAGKQTAVSSSVRFKAGAKSVPNTMGMSMPGRFFFQKFLKEAVEKECGYAILEVTSEGVLRHRHRFIDFDAAIITNLEPEHIEAHGSFENYRNSKVKFFRDVADFSSKKNKLFFIHQEMRDKEFFINAAKGKGEIIFYDKKDMRSARIKTKLVGQFNLENIAAAVAFARSQGIEWEIIKEAVEKFEGVPGRLEFVQKIPFSVVIDYAHTPDSLEKVYKAIQKSNSPKKQKGKMICVLGSAGGGRDVWKRPVMGEIAAKYCDQIFLTNEDPFDEDPQEIIDEIEAGIVHGGKLGKAKSVSGGKVRKNIDRREAIRNAIRSAKKGDSVIITGKGSEQYIRVANGKKIPWSDKEVAMRVLNNERIEV